jgi:hypothetical protein
MAFGAYDIPFGGFSMMSFVIPSIVSEYFNCFFLMVSRVRGVLQ